MNEGTRLMIRRGTQVFYLSVTQEDGREVAQLSTNKDTARRYSIEELLKYAPECAAALGEVVIVDTEDKSLQSGA